MWLATFVAIIAAALLSSCSLGASEDASDGAAEREAPPPGRIIWTADAERPMRAEWTSVSTQTHCQDLTSQSPVDERVSRVTTPTAQGRYAYRSTIQDGDDCDGERAEVGQGNPLSESGEHRLFREGQDVWISWQMRLGPTFPLDAQTWQSVVQLKQLGSLGTPVVNVDAAFGQWRLNVADGNGVSDGGRTLWAGPATRETWAKFTLHVRFSPDPARGFIELYGDLADGLGLRPLLVRTPTWTMKRDPQTGEAVRSHVRLGIYRNPEISGSAEVFYDGLTVATTREAAERNAF
jgi:hypothetical protein